MLTLLSTGVFDSKGRARLCTAMETLTPNAVVVLHSAAAADAQRAKIFSEPIRQFLAEQQLEPHYDLKFLTEYCASEPVTLLYTEAELVHDHPGTLSDAEIEALQQVSVANNLSLPMMMEMQYQLTKEMLPMVLQMMEQEQQPGLQKIQVPPERLQAIADTVRDACARFRHIVVLCDVYMVFKLEEALADLQPAVRKLNEFE